MHDPDPYIMCMPGDLRGIMRARLLEMQLAYASARVRFECSRKLRRKNMFDGVALVRGWVIGSLDRRTAFQCPSRPSPSPPRPPAPLPRRPSLTVRVASAIFGSCLTLIVILLMDRF